MDRQVIDHRSPEFADLTLGLLDKLRVLFGTTRGSVVIFPSSGTGATEAALVNVLPPGARVLAVSNGHFSCGMVQIARNLGYQVDEVELRWGEAASGPTIENRVAADNGPEAYRAVLVAHNETSTGVASDIASIRQALDAANHEALLIVDAVSSLASIPIRFDDWRIDVCITGSQKGLMLPPGLGLLCVSERAVGIGQDGGAPRHYFDWRPILRDNAAGFFPYTPATLLLYGLREALAMLVDEEGLDAVYERHARLAGAVRAAVSAWGLPTQCEDPATASNTLTAVAPTGVDTSDIVRVARDAYGLSLGIGLGQLRGKVFRIGHLGALNELEVLAALAGVELTFARLGHGIPPGSGVESAQRHLLASADAPGADRRATVPPPRSNATVA